MKKIKFIVLILIITIYPLIFCSCWNYREIDTMAIVAGMSIDKDNANNKYIGTVEIIHVETQGASSTIDSELYSSKGDSVFDTIRNVIEKTGLRLYWSDAKVLIVSEAIAREGIIPVIDWTNRDSETRSDMVLLISKDKSAAEIFNQKVQLNKIVSFHIDDTMENSKTVSKYVNSHIWAIIDEIASTSNSVTIATVKNEPTDSIIAPKIDGCAFFKGDKLVGFLDGMDTFYMLMIKNKIKEGLIVFKKVLDSDTDVTLEIFSNKTKLTPTYNNGNILMIIDVYPVVGIAEVGGSKDLMEEENLKKLQSAAETKISEELLHLITKMQLNYGSDIFGFEEVLNKNMPNIMKKFKNSSSEIFSNMKIEINLHMTIKSSGKMQKSITKKE